MSTNNRNVISEVLEKHESDLLAEWMGQQLSAPTQRGDLIKEAELREQSRRFLGLVRAAAQRGASNDLNSSGWSEVRDFLNGVSTSRARQGFSPGETATFVFSLKQPLFTYLRQELEQKPQILADEIWKATILLDKLGIFT